MPAAKAIAFCVRACGRTYRSSMFRKSEKYRRIRSAVGRAKGESVFTGIGTPAVPHNPCRDAFAYPEGTVIRPHRARRSLVLALPMQPAPQDFGSLFDAGTGAAISSGLCLECRGAKT